MKRVASLAVAVALALGTHPAFALGLGQIQVKSALGQPLLAEIPVRFDNADEAKNLRLAIASPADYQRAGISTNQMGMPLQFTLATTRDGGKVIRVTTSDPVRDPYVEFLLDASWMHGSLIREYTVLLDPPGFDNTPASAPGAAQAAASAQQTVTQPMTQPATAGGEPATTAAPAAEVAASNAGGTYRVRNGDTAYAIARHNLPAGVDIDQMLRAMQQANPQAFMHDNVNDLKRGAILRIPTRSEASEISVSAARAAVRRQMEDWRAQAPQPLLNASSAATTAAPQAAVPSGGHLELVPPAQGGGAATRAGVAGGSGDAAVAGLKQDLSRAQETLASEKLHSADLKARVEQLQKINSDNAKLLALRNNEIAQLQAKLAQVEDAANGQPAAAGSAGKPAVIGAALPGGTPAAAASTPAAASSAKQVATAGSAMAPAAAASAAKPAAAPSKPVAKPAAKPAAPQPQAETPFWMQPMVLGGAAVVVLLGLLGIAASRRKRKPAPASRPSLADQFAAVVPVGAIGDEPDADVPVDETHADEAQLREELDQHPGDLGIYLELASLQYARGDVAAFTSTAEAMHPHVDDEAGAEWQAVLAMGAELDPHHPLFAHQLAPTPAETQESPAPVEAEPAAEPPLEFHHEDFDAELDLAESSPELAEPGMHAVQPPVHTLDEPVGQPFEDPYAPMTGSAPEIGGDPIDTKLDLARAYLDMGDNDGARAMLEEVLAEGTQLQKDEAQRLLDSSH